jgi:hypothetical protein
MDFGTHFCHMLSAQYGSEARNEEITGMYLLPTNMKTTKECKLVDNESIPDVFSTDVGVHFSSSINTGPIANSCQSGVTYKTVY